MKTSAQARAEEGWGPQARANDAGASAEKNGDGSTTMLWYVAKDGDGVTRIGEADDAVAAEAIEMSRT